MAHTKGPVLLKAWDDWSAGIGYLRDDGRTPGMYTANAVLGARGELRPGPLKTDVSYSAKLATTTCVAQYFFVAKDTNGGPYLYPIMTHNLEATAGHALKIDLRNAGFAAVIESGITAAGTMLPWGQPAEYEGTWYMGYDGGIFSWDTIAVADAGDTITSNACAAGQADHLARANFQLSQVCSSYVANSVSGARILKQDGNPITTAEWGASFPVGDNSERANALVGLGGALFVLKQDGLYSFNDRGRSRLVWEDLKGFTETFKNVPMKPWKGGLVISHPTGLLWYVPGRPPVAIGPDARPEMSTSPPPGPPELHPGRYHGTAILGDIIHTIYQPDPESTTALLFSGSWTERGISWQVLDTLTLKGAAMHGLGLATSGLPTHASVHRPSLWFSDEDTSTKSLAYFVLDPTGSPYRARADTHKITTSGDAYMSELFFPTPYELSHFVAYTQDMASGDEWQMSGIANAGADDPAGAPIIASGRVEVPFEKKNVHRLMPHVKWTATSTSARAAPAIKRIELYGWPA